MSFFILQVVIGIALLVITADGLVRSALRLSELLRIPPLVVGLTVVSFGTSAPEMGVSLVAVLKGHGEMTMGNVVGSNIFNLLIIVGVSALMIPLTVKKRLLKFDLPLMVGVTVLVSWMAFNQQFERIEAVILLVCLALYLSGQLYYSHRKGRKQKTSDEIAPPPQIKTWIVTSLVFFLCLAGLILGARWFVEGATELARLFGVSELIVGLTLVALGTSLPELATSVVAALRGHGDLAIGNAIGSNIFNLLGVLGLSALVAPGVLRISQELLNRDLLFLLVMSFLALPLFATKQRVDRWEGLVFVSLYLVYMIILYLAAGQSLELYHLSLKLVLWLSLPFLVVYGLCRHRFFAR